MKKMKFKVLIALMSILVLGFVSSCKEDDPIEPVSNIPVLDEDFTFTIVNNDVNFTTTLIGNVWFRNITSETDIQAVDGAATVYLAVQGEYPFTCSTLIEGETFTSDTFSVGIAETDLSFLDTGVWHALTGGRTGGKVWKLDIGPVSTTTIDDAGVETVSTVNKSSFFHNPVDFYGDAEVGGAADNIWGPWGGTSLYDWGGTPEDGNISFNGADGTVKLMLDGVETDGSFTMTTYDRDPNFLTLTENNGGLTLWENMLTNKYSYLGSLSPQMADISMSEGLRFPMDVGRITNDGNATNPSQFLDDDLRNITLMHASDSALVVRVKRSFEGDGPSLCWMLYNYIVDGYSYTAPTYTHPVRTDVTVATLTGTWKPAIVPYDWIGWSSKASLNPTWVDAASVIASGWAATDSSLAADALLRITFNADGSCVMNGQSTTYTINQGGYIAFADDVTIPTYMVTLTGKNIYVVDVPASTDGIWLGQNNGDKSETSSIHFVKE